MSDREGRLRRMEQILAVTRELSSTTALEPLLTKIVDTAAELTDSEGASILLLDTRTGELRFRAAASPAPDQLAEIPVPIEGSIAGTVLTTGEPVIVSDARADPRHYGEVGQQVGLEVHSLLAVPLRIKDRRIGALEAINKHGSQGFTEEDIETLMALASQAAVAIENARLVGALQEAYDRLSELDRLKSDFIAIASHELRTPLGLILGYASALQHRVEGTAAGQLEVVLRAASQLKQTMETMLNLRYLETGQMEMVPSLFDIRAEVEEVCQAQRALAQAKGVELEADLPDAEIPLLADREKVRVVLDNLVSNAVKFTPVGGLVRIEVQRQPDALQVAVSDTGCGIPPEELDGIFDSFYQVESHMTRRYNGMGLGLSIVKGLVELHGGRVWAESASGQGSCFFVILPMKPDLGSENGVGGPRTGP